MKKRFIEAVLIVLLSVSLRTWSEPIRIGAILPVTGNNGITGQNMRDGMQLAVEEINKRGGVNGNRIEIVLEDSKSDPQAAVAAFARMESGRPPLFYVSFVSSIGMALAPLAEDKHVVLAGLVTAARDFTLGREWVFRYWPLGQAYVAPLLHILQDLKAKKLGILYQNDEFGVEQYQLMSRQYADMGGSVEAARVEMKDVDFRSKIASLKNQDAIYAAFTGNLLSVALKQIKESGYPGSVLSPVGAANPALFDLPELDGVYVTAPIIHNPNYLYAKDAGDKFVSRYKKPFDQWAANGYDFIRLVSGLLEDRQITRQGVRDLLAGGFEYSGVFGSLKVKAGGHDFSFQLYPAQVVNGALKYR